ncbi:MAG: prepilin-type N-terminal cleavage/methylation domain-containing protein [Propionivibrio sp.]|nr:prepilin-type N-terminal cleavage/methylation domain-containing protein [Propionivibrio sp.]
MLSKLMAMTKAELKSKIQSIDVSAVKGRNLRRKFETIRSKKEGGFTLLELLVVVAILAAIAGTATVMLQDTDRKASAGAHVAMMDQLASAINQYRTFHNAYPDRWDSLLQNGTNVQTGAAALAMISDDLLGSIGLGAVTAAELSSLTESGIERVRMFNTAGTLTDDGGTTYTCGATKDAQQAIINNKSLNTTAQNIYRPEDGNGCGFDADLSLAVGPVMTWNAAENKRVNAWNTGDVVDGVTLTADDKLVAFGAGSEATLFDPTKLGALSTSPIYRHVEPDEYNRFIVLFKVSGVGVNSGKALFQAIVDGAGDTKDEELGELDNVRNT